MGANAPHRSPLRGSFTRKKRMKIKFVNIDDIPNRGKRSEYNWSEFIEELYKYPNQWAEFPKKIANSTTAYRVKEAYNDIDVKIAGGNNLAKHHPNKQHWTVYLCYTPTKEND